MIIAIDFDGTIVENKYPKIGTLRKGAKAVINRLYDSGHFIIIYTCRGGQQGNEAYQFLKQKRIKFHKFNENAPYEMIKFVPSAKIFADVYIDDKNLGGIPEWKEIERILKEVKK